MEKPINNIIVKLLRFTLAKASKYYARLFYLDEINSQNVHKFREAFDSFKNKSRNNLQRFDLKYENAVIYTDDNTDNTVFDTHYVYHPAWAARIVKHINPEFHIDISSTLHFCSILSAFIPVKFYDYRPAKLNLSHLESDNADLTQLHFSDNSISSLSCMHTIEHIGLGRYGDPFDYDGDLKAAAELTRVLTTGGNLLIVVPVGKPKILFNAHRIYSYNHILEMFKDLQLMEFSLITDDALSVGMTFNASRELADQQNYGCGCFWFKKI